MTNPHIEAYNSKKYVCIMYPGIVKNEEKMLETLGGIDTISGICSMPNRRLELRFRPDDLYSHSACGDRVKGVSFLLKVKVRRKKNTVAQVTNSASRDESIERICEPIVLGRVEMMFQFKTLCDFQYLPIQCNKEGQAEVIYDQLVPKYIPNPDWFKQPAPAFLPPAAFSRMDNVQFYLYRKEANDNADESNSSNLIGRTRCRRSAHAVFVTFDVPAAPSKPRPSCMKYLQVKFLYGEPYQKLVQMFKERPVWSKTAIKCETKYTREQLKYLVPTVAYYFVTGPFRIMWVRMGYDPRKDPSSKIYQTLDYRIPDKGGLTRYIKAKRDDLAVPFKVVNSVHAKTVSILKESKEKASIPKDPNHEDNYIFKPGCRVPARQMFYQYCDIKVPEVEEMFARLPKQPLDAECHRQRGWLPAGFAERVREILTSEIFKNLEESFIKKEESGATEEKSNEDGTFEVELDEENGGSEDEESMDEVCSGQSEDDSDNPDQQTDEYLLKSVLS